MDFCIRTSLRVELIEKKKKEKLAKPFWKENSGFIELRNGEYRAMQKTGKFEFERITWLWGYIRLRC